MPRKNKRHAIDGRKINGDRQGTYATWTMAEITWLKANFAFYAYTKDMCPYLPRHSYDAIVKRGQALRLTRVYQGRTRHVAPLEIWWALQDRPMTGTELMETLGLKRCAVQTTLQTFRDAGVVHVHHWCKRGVTGGRWIAAYAAGTGFNRKKPLASGRTSDMYGHGLKAMKGNPFGLMLLGASNGNAEREEDVCTG